MIRSPFSRKVRFYCMYQLYTSKFLCLSPTLAKETSFAKLMG